MATKGKSVKSSNKSHSPTSSHTSLSSSGRRSAKNMHLKHQGEEKETLAYKILPADTTKTLSEIEDVDELQLKIADFLKLTDSIPVDLQDAATVDYYVSGFWWGKEQGYSTDQLSALFTVLHTLLNNVKEKHMGVIDNLKEYKKMLVGIGTDTHMDQSLPFGGLDCFDVSQAKALTEYLHISLFQHHKLFEFVLTHTQAEEVIGTDLEVETPKAADVPWPPPLIEAVTEDMYQQFIATPPPTPAQPEDADSSKEDEETAPTEEELQKEADLLSQLTPEEVRKIMEEVFDEMLSGLKSDVAGKLREKENAFVARINKIHNVAES